MKQNKTGLIILAAVAAFFLMRKKEVPVVLPELPPPPPPPPDGVLTVSEKKEALAYYSNNNGYNWSPKLPLMSSLEIESLYAYWFECRLLGKCIPTPALLQRINNIKYKYQITIPT